MADGHVNGTSLLYISLNSPFDLLKSVMVGVDIVVHRIPSCVLFIVLTGSRFVRNPFGFDRI